jgi:hypothetical protein
MQKKNEYASIYGQSCLFTAFTTHLPNTTKRSAYQHLLQRICLYFVKVIIMCEYMSWTIDKVICPLCGWVPVGGCYRMCLMYSAVSAMYSAVSASLYTIFSHGNSRTMTLITKGHRQPSYLTDKH